MKQTNLFWRANFLSGLALWAVACGASPVPTAGQTVEAAAPAAPVVLVPPTPAGRALLWAIDAVDPQRDEPTVADIEARFSPAFHAAVPPLQVALVLRTLRSDTGGFTLDSLEQTTDAQIVAVARAADGTAWRIFVSASQGAPFLIDGLIYRPAPELDIARPNSWPELVVAVRALAPDVSLLAAQVEGERCVSIAAHASDTQRAVGSAFKLYVLGAVLDAIGDGTVAWDALLPTSERTLFEAAEQMIAVSDNSATDEIITLLGRSAVEAALTTWGHAAPEQNRPFLTTLEMLVLKGVRNGEIGDRFMSHDEAGRREVLDGITPVEVGAIEPWGEPRLLGIEWFASTDDLCTAMARLHERAEISDDMAVARHVMSINAGVAIRSSDWLYAAYKGGSEPGVLNLTWLLESPTRGRYFFAMTLNNAEATINDALAVALAAIGIDLLAEEARAIEAAGP